MNVCRPISLSTFGGFFGELRDDELVLRGFPGVCVVRLTSRDGGSPSKGFSGAWGVKRTTGILLVELLAEELHQFRRKTTGVRRLVCTSSVAAVTGEKREEGESIRPTLCLNLLVHNTSLCTQVTIQANPQLHTCPL